MKKLFAIAAFGLVAAVGAPAMADSKQCQPDFTIWNDKATAIKVISVQYKVANGTWEEEGLSNRILGHKKSSVWKSQTLKHAVEGVVITQTRVKYRDDTGGGWSGEKLSAAVPHTPACTDKANYHQGVP